ncbi:caspase domain-containing protein [Armillaria fumosa]|nr:caspase domain-containing protein [Armillaria fumosa]
MDALQAIFAKLFGTTQKAPIISSFLLNASRAVARIPSSAIGNGHLLRTPPLQSTARVYKHVQCLFKVFPKQDLKEDADNAISSESESIAKEICLLEKFMLLVAHHLGMSSWEGVDVEVAVFHEAQALGMDSVLLTLERLRRLRLQYNGTQDNLPDKLELYLYPSQSRCRVDGSRFYAVLIGIDEYASYPLQGCVSDVRLLEKHLAEDLGVPRNRIQLLLGSKEHPSPGDPMYPSRAHIIDTLLNITHNPEIIHGDNIVIFYAGHGSRYPFQVKCGAIEYIEALCPIDRDTIGDDDKPVPDISDREFNTILTRISQAKGHCITVILDCCHSGSVSRGVPGAGARTSSPTRCATLQDMLIAGDKKLRGSPGYRSISSKDWRSDMSSHVVMAACKEYQFATSKMVKGEDEAERHNGIFTDSLVRVLRSGYYTRETTYVDLVHSLHQTPHQMPIVAGEHRNARIWYQE